jgi:hypothetical protein
MRWNEINETEEVITEINLIPDFDDDVNLYRKLHNWAEGIKSSTKVGTIRDLNVRKGVEEHGTTMYYLIADRQAKGKATVVDRGNNTVKISHIWFSPEIRGKGYGFAFYEFLLKSGCKIISDWDQTRHSKAVWQKLAKTHMVYELLMNDEIGERVTDVSAYYEHPHAFTMLIASLAPINESEKLDLPDIEIGTDILVGKFKNRKATITGFKKDDHNQPVLKTTKGDQKLFKPRFPKLDT